MTTTTTTKPSAPSKETGFSMLRLHLQNPPPARMQAYFSGEIKSPMSRFRNQASPYDYVRLPLEAEEYLAHTRVSFLNAQSNVNVAAKKALQHKLQEMSLLLNIGKSGRDTSQLEPGVALTLARLARATLASEYELALAKLGACQNELVILQDAVDEALVFLTDADNQVGSIFNTLDNAHIPIPTHPLFSSPSSRKPTFERPDHLFSFPMDEEEETSSSDSFCSCNSGGEGPLNPATSFCSCDRGGGSSSSSPDLTAPIILPPCSPDLTAPIILPH